jgi:TPR repeat protein
MRLVYILLGVLLVMPTAQANQQCSEKTPYVCVSEGSKLIRAGKVDEGHALLISACGYNYSAGCLKTGIIYERQKNLEKAKEFYQKACDINNKKECRNVQAVQKKINAAKKK